MSAPAPVDLAVFLIGTLDLLIACGFAALMAAMLLWAVIATVRAARDLTDAARALLQLLDESDPPPGTEPQAQHAAADPKPIQLVAGERP